MTDQGRAQALAEQVGAALRERDNSARFLDLGVDEIRPGYARVSMTVTEPMLNGIGICHGGFTFMLADDAFAYACSSYNRVAVGVTCTISYPASAQLGDRLTAECHEIHRKGRTGTYDCTVTTQDKVVVALFRGQCRVLEAHIIEGNS
ncbi:phenylacetate pathway hotdog-fold thioesterase [Candidatus Terasakiella magnetica]|nr:phenylacetate pathway hotdog-fold thioesterase [Candidatus Terasakiella magnetica]